ncbi:YARHG domain-containing protein [Pedobacter changchengzhani]|uniref:YARHG domain-containing protein n=1 Tax=Pedobacter changchengzhani TaxID=2529274 RepID=A0A4R5MQX7_9SPHI|nr:YARHG domain-containing protein [Pedobacter changchengzhani]TDG37905.1 YARHG domain-containing protein [Pedobacter changchengzhani]
MKKILLIACTSILLFACNGKKKPTETPQTTEPTVATIVENHKELYGFWVGDFVSNDEEDFMESYLDKLNITIKRISKDSVLAQSVVFGNSRPLKGTIDTNKTEFSFILDEPATKKGDGRFKFKLRKDTLIGTWVSFDKKKTREFKLLKKNFVYDASQMLSGEDRLVDWFTYKQKTTIATNDGVKDTTVNTLFRSTTDKIFKINASTTELKESDVKNLRKLELQILKNTIFARHGYAFKSEIYRQFFDPQDWYVPVSDNVNNDLTAIEHQNIALLDRFIKYATDNYDSFGR